MRNNEEAGVAKAKGVRDEVRKVAENQVMNDLLGHCRHFGFYTEGRLNGCDMI